MDDSGISDTRVTENDHVTGGVSGGRRRDRRTQRKGVSLVTVYDREECVSGGCRQRGISPERARSGTGARLV